MVSSRSGRSGCGGNIHPHRAGIVQRQRAALAFWDHVVDEITGRPGKAPLPPSVEGLKLRNVVTGAETLLKVDGVFVAIGLFYAFGLV